MAKNMVVLIKSANGRRLVRAKCKAAGLDIAVLERLIDTELDYSGRLRKRGITQDFDDIFGALDEEQNQ